MVFGNWLARSKL